MHNHNVWENEINPVKVTKLGGQSVDDRSRETSEESLIGSRKVTAFELGLDRLIAFQTGKQGGISIR